MYHFNGVLVNNQVHLAPHWPQSLLRWTVSHCNLCPDALTLYSRHNKTYTNCPKTHCLLDMRRDSAFVSYLKCAISNVLVQCTSIHCSMDSAPRKCSMPSAPPFSKYLDPVPSC